MAGLAVGAMTVDRSIGGAETAAGAGLDVNVDDAADTYDVQTAAAGDAADGAAGAAVVGVGVGVGVDNDAPTGPLTAHSAAESTRGPRLCWCSSLGSAGFGPRPAFGTSRTAVHFPGAARMQAVA